MAVAGALFGKAIGAFGRKPNIPELPQIDPSRVQSETIAANQAALPAAQQFASSVNEFNTQQQLGMLSKALEFISPGGLNKSREIIGSQLRGEIPDDVAAQIRRLTASKGFSSGFGANSGIGRNLTARDFGLTSMGLQQQGMNSLFSLAPQTPQFNMTSMFFTPQQRLEAAFQDRSQQFQRNLLAEQVAAAPDPATAALGREIDRFFNTAASFGMSAAGGGMGGG
jgi:hypothetical protein